MSSDPRDIARKANEALNKANTGTDTSSASGSTSKQSRQPKTPKEKLEKLIPLVTDNWKAFELFITDNQKKSSNGNEEVMFNFEQLHKARCIMRDGLKDGEKVIFRPITEIEENEDGQDVMNGKYMPKIKYVMDVCSHVGVAQSMHSMFAVSSVFCGQLTRIFNAADAIDEINNPITATEAKKMASQTEQLKFQNTELLAQLARSQKMVLNALSAQMSTVYKQSSALFERVNGEINKGGNSDVLDEIIHAIVKEINNPIDAKKKRINAMEGQVVELDKLSEFEAKFDVFMNKLKTTLSELDTKYHDYLEAKTATPAKPGKGKGLMKRTEPDTPDEETPDEGKPARTGRRSKNN